MASPIFACLEAGGTKVIASVARGPEEVLDGIRVPTTDPETTVGAALAFFERAAGRFGRPVAAGIASFGPVELDPQSPCWGHIVSTPKQGWSGFDLAGTVGRALGCPVGFDTDVNGAVLAEARWGAAVGADVAIYITVGTGIGGGVLVGGRPVHGARHPEMGHMLPRRHPLDTGFAGICPYHGDCLEGLASGPAIMARWGCSLSDLPQNLAAHEVIADYLAQLVVAQVAMLSPQRIVLGGGVTATPGLIDRVRARAVELGRGYFGVDERALIVPPGLGERSGLLGALALALDVVA